MEELEPRSDWVEELKEKREDHQIHGKRREVGIYMS